MARKRMIDPDIWTDERFATLGEGEQLFFIALFSQADDEGRLEWSPLQFKLRCAPASQHLPNVFEDRKNAILAAGLAHQYEINGRVYLLLPGWFKTQKLERGAVSKIPDPPDLSTNPALSDYFCNLLTIREYQENRLKNSDRQKMSENGRECQPEGKGREEKGKRREEKDLGAAPDFENLESDVSAFIANAASENKTGKVSPGRELSLRRELAEIRVLFGDEVFSEALRETNCKGIPNPNYVKRVAESAQRRGPKISALPAREQHGYLNGEKYACVRGREPNGWMTVPPRGKRMADLWPEHRSSAIDFEPGVA